MTYTMTFLSVHIKEFMKKLNKLPITRYQNHERHAF